MIDTSDASGVADGGDAACACPDATPPPDPSATASAASATTPTPSPPHPDLAAIEAAYADRSQTVASIAARYGLAVRDVTSMARTNGWTLRHPSPARGKSGRKSGRRRKPYTRILARLYTVLERNLTRMEQDMDDSPEGSPADGERTTRTLQGMIRSVDKLRTMEARADAGSNATATDAAAAAREADRLRLELASRLIELCERRHPTPGDS